MQGCVLGSLLTKTAVPHVREVIILSLNTHQKSKVEQTGTFEEFLLTLIQNDLVTLIT